MVFGTKSPSLVTIFVSSSRCIFENLAFEEWLFRNHNMCSNGDSLLIWRNSPAVVIGRYQNPWLESDVRFCQANGIRLARRHSGGGAVYHDEGNLNISVLTTHEGHSRKRNLQILAHFLNAELLCRPPDDVDIGTSRLIANSRDDLLIGKPPNGGAKVSGTAARIARGRAYHHFTLLVDVGMDALRHSLNSPFKDRIETNASRSVPAKSVGNLAQHIKRSTNHLVGTEELVEKVTDCVLRAFISQYESSKLVRWGGEVDKLRGIDEILNNLRSDDWVYGKTPKFTLQLMDNGGAICVENNGLICESSNGQFSIGTPFHKAFLSLSSECFN